jgi:hypothetical protein
MKALALVLALAAAAPSGPSMREGIRLVDEGDLQSAVTTLTTALERLDAAHAPERERALGYVYLGMAQLGLGHQDPARASLRLAYLLNQGGRLDAKRFPPRVVRLYDEVGTEVRNRNRGGTKSTRSLAIIGTGAGVGLGAVAAVVAGGSGSSGPPATTPIAQAPVSVRLFNNDDLGRVFVGGTLLRQVGLGEDTGLVDVTSRLTAGSNEVAFELENAHGAISYGFEVYVGETVVFRETCGVVFRGGCDGDQRFPAGVVRRFTFTVQR